MKINMKKKNLPENTFKDVVDFITGFSRRLCHIDRFNTRPVIRKENVADHSFYVVLFSSILSEIAELNNIKINKYEVLLKAVLHDIEESISGDISKALKKDSKFKNLYLSVSELSVKRILSPLPLPISTRFLDNWKNKNASTENLIVKIADELSGIVYAREEIIMGNSYFEHIYFNYMHRLESLVKDTIFENLILQLNDKKMKGDMYD